MSIDLTLRKRAQDLSPKNVARALEAVCATRELKAYLADKNTTVGFRVALPADDDEHVRIAIAFGKDTLRGSARGRGGPLLSWCFHAIAEELGCDLDDPQGASDGAGASYEAALDVVREHEKEVLEDRAYSPDTGDTGDSLPPSSADEEGKALAQFLAWLVATEKLALADEDDLGELAGLSHLAAKPADLYEALLDAPEVDDIFVSEAEFVDLLRKYRDGKR
jgi:hypothetical protein